MMQSLEIFGVEIPRIGFGTWAVRGASGLQVLHDALDLGYRHFDTAEMYRNEDIVGQVVADSGLDRDEIFVTTKAWSDNLTHVEVKRACEQSLRRLNMDYVDLYLIHRPGAAPLEETLAGMQELVSEGKTRFIGVSNFSVDQLKRSLSISAEPILTNQVEFHPFNRREALSAFCRRNEVLLTAYTPFARGRVLRSNQLQDIGRRYGKTPAQITLRWLVQQGNVITIPKASSEKHQRENMDIFDFELSEEEMEKINGLGSE